MSCQAVASQIRGSIHSASRALGARDGSARQNGEIEGLEGGWHLAARDGYARQ